MYAGMSNMSIANRGVGATRSPSSGSLAGTESSSVQNNGVQIPTTPPSNDPKRFQDLSEELHHKIASILDEESGKSSFSFSLAATCHDQNRIFSPLRLNRRKISEKTEFKECLKDLNITNNAFSDENSTKIIHSLVKTICDEDSPFKSLATRHLKLYLTGVAWINLMGCNIGDKGAVEVAKALENNATVTTISLSDNHIGNEGAIALADALRNNNTVTEIFLASNQIGDEGVIALAELVKNNSVLNTILNALYLGRNQFGDEGDLAIGSLIKQYPNLEI